MNVESGDFLSGLVTSGQPISKPCFAMVSAIDLRTDKSSSLFQNYSLIGGQISNSHPSDANESYSSVFPMAVASFFSNDRGNREFSARVPLHDSFGVCSRMDLAVECRYSTNFIN
jgi:hypothetical protein